MLSRATLTSAGSWGRLAIPLVALGAGIAVAIAPLPALAGGVGIVGLIGVALIGDRIPRVFVRSLAVLLIGYAFFGRSFAYLGVPPLFIGEVVLGLGVLTLLMVQQRALFGRVQFTILLFIGWGVLRTVPYLGVHGVDAIRDAVAWIYALFALAVASVVEARHFPSIIALYQRMIPAYLAWAPVAFVAIATLPLPTLPISGVEILSFKGGDAGIHLAAIAAFIFVGLYGSARSSFQLPISLVWALYLGAAGLVAILNRGGMLAMTMCATALVFARRASRVVSLVFVGTFLLTVIIAVDPQVEIGNNRPFSVGQVLDNVSSILGESEDAEIGGALQGSKSFRLEWWSTIVDYTIGGEFFWGGKGFGINLADDDGFQPLEDGSLRSPHNGHVEVLARMGVPGVILWGLLNLTYALSLARAATRAAAGGRHEWVMILAWLFVYWAATMVNASFDPYLQGPQGGIWYWSMMGLGLAAIRASERPAPWVARPAADERAAPGDPGSTARDEPGHAAHPSAV